RKPKVVNLFKRIKVLSPDNIHVRNYSRKKPIAAFNPGAYYDSKTDDILIFPRLVFDYYWYVSSIGVFHFNINNSDQEVYETDIILWPKEIWEMAKGLEDPRVASFDQKFYFLHTSVSFNKQKSGILPLQGFTITDYNFNIIKKGYIKIKDGDEIYIPQSFKDSALIDFKKGEFSSLLRPMINGIEINWF
ncbi:MAG: hypothetical protein JZD40_01830, partial [Sulfolobus sp.]|nr:hypothetical protein [Sulfolobus sp.]